MTVRSLVSMIVLLLGTAACGGKSLDSHQIEDSGGSTGNGVPGGGAPGGGAPGGGAPSDADAGPEVDACVSNSDCQLIPRACCSCGSGPISDFASINRSSVDTFRAQICATNRACGPCPPIVPGSNAPENYYIATCQAGRCIALDLHAEPATDCAADSDCQGRSGTECCDVCGNTPNLALNKQVEGKVRSLLCDPAAPTCQDCGRSMPQVGAGVFPRCEGGKCSLTSGCNMCF